MKEQPSPRGEMLFFDEEGDDAGDTDELPPPLSSLTKTPRTSAGSFFSLLPLLGGGNPLGAPSRPTTREDKRSSKGTKDPELVTSPSPPPPPKVRKGSVPTVWFPPLKAQEDYLAPLAASGSEEAEAIHLLRQRSVSVPNLKVKLNGIFAEKSQEFTTELVSTTTPTSSPPDPASKQMPPSSLPNIPAAVVQEVPRRSPPTVPPKPSSMSLPALASKPTASLNCKVPLATPAVATPAVRDSDGSGVQFPSRPPPPKVKPKPTMPLLDARLSSQPQGSS